MTPAPPVINNIANGDAEPANPQQTLRSSDRFVGFLKYAHTLGNGVLKLGDGIIFGLPCGAAIAAAAILAHPLRGWLEEITVLLIGAVAGLAGGAALGWFIGRRFVAGQWLTSKLRSLLLKSSAWIVFAGIVGVFFHDLLLPLSQRLDRKIEAIRELAQSRAMDAAKATPAKRGMVMVGSEIIDESVARYRRAEALNDQAKNEQNPQTKKDLEKARDTEQAKGDKLAEVGKKLTTTPDDPAKIKQVLDEATKEMRNGAPETTVTQSDSAVPIWLKILAVGLPIPELMGLDWGFGSKTIKTTIEQIYAGNPPSADELKRLLGELQSEQQRQTALAEIKQIVESVVKDPNKRAAFEKAAADIQSGDWASFAKGVLDSVPPGSSTDNMAGALVDALRDRLPVSGQDVPVFPSDDLKKMFSDGVKSAHPKDANAILAAVDKRLQPGK